MIDRQRGMSGNRNGNKPGCTTLYARHIPPRLYIRFQAWCKLRGVFYKDKLISLMKKAISDTSDPTDYKLPFVKIERWKAGNKTINVRNVPISLLRHFQAWCKLRDVTPAEKLIAMMNELTQETGGADQ